MSYKRFFVLLHKGTRSGLLTPDHHELVSDYTGGRKNSLRELTPAELRGIEQALEQLLNDPEAAACQRMRRKVIGIMAARGAINAQGRPDMPRIYAWVRRYGHAKKELNRYTKDELITLVHQAERVVASDMKAISQYHG